MANTLTLTSFAENIFRARDIVAREQTGFVNSVMTNTDSDEVSINGFVNSLQTSAPTLNTSTTPAMTIPAGDDQTVANVTMQLDKNANVRIPLTGEDTRKLQNVGQYESVVTDMFAQGIRAMVNQIEADVALAALVAASRATGTAGTTPFGSNFNIIADARQILIDNGAGAADLNMVMSTLAGTKLRQLANIFQANVAGSDATVRTGELLDMYGVKLGESAGVQSHTAGTGTGYLAAATEPVGETSLSLDTGAGTILAGDVITFTGDSNKYVVKTGFAGDGVGTIVIQAPGLIEELDDTTALTIGATYTGNIAFRKPAIELALRPYAVPNGGDAADDRMVISDDVSPLVFDVNLYKGYKMNMLELNVVYGAKVWKPEFVATVLG